MLKGEKSYTAHLFRAESHARELEEVFYFRKRLFIDRLGWALATIDQLEIDEFDGPETTYAALKYNERLVGCFRMIRGDRPYLAERVFPELAITKPYPKTERSYEVSRFGVWPERGAYEHANVLYALMFQFALFRRLASIVAVTDRFHERYLSKKNIRTRRFGPPRQYHGASGAPSFTLVAGEIPIRHQSAEQLESLLSNLNGVNIHDHTLVFGRQRISA